MPSPREPNVAAADIAQAVVREAAPLAERRAVAYQDGGVWIRWSRGDDSPYQGASCRWVRTCRVVGFTVVTDSDVCRMTWEPLAAWQAVTKTSCT